MLHKTAKTVVAACLSAAFLLQPALAAPVLPEGWQSPFSDVEAGAWYAPYISELHQQGVVGGYTDGRFGVGDPAYVGQSILMIVKAAGCTAGDAKPGEHYASAYADYAVKKGWLTRAEVDGQLDTPASRLYIFRLAAKALDLDPVEGQSPFADIDDGYVTALYQAGLLAGVTEGDKLLCKPQDGIVRSELSTIVWKVMDYMKDKIRFGSHVLAIKQNVPAFSRDRNAFVRNGERLTYNGQEVQPRWGVDVSIYQKDIDWQAVANAGVDFAIIRAGFRGYTTGGIKEDANFHQNIQGAQAAGLDTGVYFFSQAITEEEAREEARFLLERLEGYNITGPVVFDWENISKSKGPARTDNISTETLTAVANAFCEEIAASGYQPMIYFNQYIAYLMYDLEGIMQYPFWLAEYTDKPNFYYDFEMWQYSSRGSIDGIPGRVDMNLWFQPIQGW